MSVRHVWRMLLCFVILAAVSAATMGGFSDTFDGPGRDAAWREVDVTNSAALIIAKPVAGTLEVTGIEKANPKKRRVVQRRMARPCEPIKGDFTATMDLSWDQHGAAAMFGVKLVVLSADGKVLASGGLLDGWIGHPAKTVCALGAEDIQGGVVPDKAAAEVRIERQGDVYTVYLRDMVLVKGKGLNQAVAQVAVDFGFNDYGPTRANPKSHFGEIGIDKIMIESGVVAAKQASVSSEPWTMGTPIVTYWAGPHMTDAAAKQMADGGWNLVWCRDAWDLDIIHKYRLRGILSNRIWQVQNLDDPEKRAQLDAFIDSVKTHPALYAYHIKDEPRPHTFADLARIKAYLDEKDPSRLKYINLYPNYASAEQLGFSAEPLHVAAYEQHVRKFVEVYKPQLLSYDHYSFAVKGDRDKYFLNLAQMRRFALEYDLPFMVIVQACSWTVNMRIPTGEELRWLTYTTLAYGSRGISHYVYGYRGHDGAMINQADGSPTPLYYTARELNKEFLVVANELKALKSLAVYHVGMLPEGTVALPEDALFRLEPPFPPKEYTPPKPVEGFVIGYFGKGEPATHALLVNLDYRTYSGRGHERREEFLKSVQRSLVGPGKLQVFNVAESKWTDAEGGDRVELRLPPSGALLVRVRPQ